MNKVFRLTQNWRVNENIEIKTGETIRVLEIDYYIQAYKIKFENYKEPQIIPISIIPNSVICNLSEGLFVPIYL